MPSNYFALEPIIKAHLQDIESIQAVYTPFSVDDMLESTAVAPSISVIYVDDRVGESAGNGSASIVYQQWLIVLCVEEAGSQSTARWNEKQARCRLSERLIAARCGMSAHEACKKFKFGGMINYVFNS